MLTTRHSNLVAAEGADNRSSSVRLAAEHPDELFAEAEKIIELELPARHQITRKDINPDKLYSIFVKTYEAQSTNYEELLSLRGVGPKSLRALALLSELIYGAAPSFKDPVRYSYAHGGKDGHPYHVARDVYDNSIEFLREVVNKSKIEASDKQRAFKQLAAFYARGER